MTDLDIWNRQSGEGVKPFSAFKIYLDLGEDRSLEKVSQKSAKSIPLLKRWSSRWEWVNRAAAYDTHIAVIEEIARDKERSKRAAEIERRRIQVQDSSWLLFQEIDNRVKKMLAFPLADCISKDGQTVVKAARWTYDTLPRLVEAMVKLGKIAAGIGSEPAPHINVDWESLSDEQLERIANGENPLQVLISCHSDRKREAPNSRRGESLSE